MSEKVISSDVFLALVTKSYLKDVRNEDEAILEQISVAKEFNKPCFLMFVDLSTMEVVEGKEIFKKHRVIASLITKTPHIEGYLEVFNFIGKMKRWLERNKP